MRCACIDIGSNTTRLLVADCRQQQLQAVHQERVFTHIGRAVDCGAITPEKISEVAEGVARQLELARSLGSEDIRAVATAAIRRASNGPSLIAAIRAGSGLEVRLLSAEEEARLAFVGAARTMGHVPHGALGVVDVGGGSSELAVGTPPDKLTWSGSLELGSSNLTAAYLHSDPPSQTELSEARLYAEDAMRGLQAPRPDEAVAVGGSATSLRRFAGPVLDSGALVRSLNVLAGRSAVEVAEEFALDVDRVHLLPAGLLILEAASRLFGVALQIGCGGLREGVLLEACA